MEITKDTIKKWAIEQITEHIKRSITYFLTLIGLAGVWMALKTWLKTEHTLDLAGWLWLVIFAATAGLPCLIATTIDARRKRKAHSHLLDGDIDVVAALCTWITKQIEKYKGSPVTKHFVYADIDNTCGVIKGTAKIYMAEIIDKFNKTGANIEVIKPLGEKTIVVSFLKRNLGSNIDITVAIMEWLRKKSRICEGDTVEYETIDTDCNIPLGSSKAFFKDSNVDWICVRDDGMVAKFMAKGDKTIMITFSKKGSPGVTIPDRLK